MVVFRSRRAARAEKLQNVLDSDVVGKIGFLTGRVAPGLVGEVMLAVRGGSEAYHAYGCADDEPLPVGTRVVVVEHHPPRTVIVTPA